MTSRRCPALSPLSFGAAGIAGLYHRVDPEAADATVRRALELGVTYFDTAPHYGAGLSEQRLGRTLRTVPRESFLLSTKVGRLLRTAEADAAVPQFDFAEPTRLQRVWDFSADGIRRSLEESLERLGLDRVDIVYLHDPDEHEPQVYDEAFPALHALREQGVIRAIGAGMTQSAMLTRLVDRLDLDVVLIAGRYTLLDQRAAADLLPACVRREVAVVAGGVFNSGILADPDRTATFDYAPANTGIRARARELRDTAESHGVPLIAAALQFPMGHPAVATVLNGARSVAEMEANADAFAVQIPSAFWQELRDRGLLPSDVPTPARRSVLTAGVGEN